MPKAQYVGVEGVARKVKKSYIGVDGVARKVKKGYVGVEGVARQYFSSDVAWEKFSCTKTATGYHNYVEDPNNEEVGTAIEVSGNSSSNTFSAYTGYEFSSQGGYTGTGHFDANAENGLGAYYIYKSGDESLVLEILSIEITGSSNFYIKRGCICVAYAKGEAKGYTYKKGTKSYGTVYAQEGDLPEKLYYVEGSEEEGYYILKYTMSENASHFYYTIKEE